MNPVRPRSFKEFNRVYGKAFLHEQGNMADKTYSQLEGCRSVVENFIKKQPYTVDIYDPSIKDGDKMSPFFDEIGVRVEHLGTGTIYEESFFDIKNRDPIVRQIYQFISEVVGTSGKNKKPIDDHVSNSRWRFFNYLERRKKAAKSSEIQQQNTVVNNT